MKPISKTFKFSGGNTLKVSDDGYEWCGKMLGRDECGKLDYAALNKDNEYMFARHLRELSCECDAWGADVKPVVRFVRRNWVWIKGS